MQDKGSNKERERIYSEERRNLTSSSDKPDEMGRICSTPVEDGKSVQNRTS